MFLGVLEDQEIAVKRDIERYDTLVSEDGNDDYDSEGDDSSDDESEGAVGGTSYNPSPQKTKYEERSIEEMREVVRYRTATITGPRKMSSILSRFRWIRDANHYYYIEKKVKKAGSRNDKVDRINEYVLQRFIDASANECRIHDLDLVKWALYKKREIDWKDFKASKGWVDKFKKKNRIGIRTITHIVSKKSIESAEMIKSIRYPYVESIRSMMKTIPLSSIFNVDQSGFRKELHSGGTLRVKGAKKIEAVVQSVTSTTHSYTIMPVISANGILCSPMFVVLQETTGENFGPRVVTTMKRPNNLYIRCSKSGLVTKKLMNEWFIQLFLQGFPLEKHLLCDSLSTYKNTDEINALKPANQKYQLHFIPPGTTGFVQPLDVFFFRQWKTFVKKITDHVIMENCETQLYQRDSILVLQSLVHNQFSCPRFQPFIRQLWIKAGYVSTVEDFEHPIDVCFRTISKCSEDCDESPLIRCAWCYKELCFNHFFIQYHMHN